MAERKKNGEPTPPTPNVPATIERSVEYVVFGSDERLKLTVQMVQQFIAHPTKSGVMPSLGDCLHFIMMCKARGLNPWEGDCYLLGYDSQMTGPTFSMITAHQAFLKRAELNPEFDGMESGVIVRDEEGIVHEKPGDLVLPGETLIGGWAKVHSKGRTFPTYRRLDLKKYDKARSIWKDNPAMMIVKCAEADGLRSTYPTKLGGLYLREEMDRIEKGESTSIPTPAAEGATPEDLIPKTATEKLAEKVAGGQMPKIEEAQAVVDESQAEAVVAEPIAERPAKDLKLGL